MKIFGPFCLIFMKCIFPNVSRNFNNVVDNIAKRAKSLGICETWISSIPGWICLLVDYDQFSFARVAF